MKFMKKKRGDEMDMDLYAERVTFSLTAFLCSRNINHEGKLVVLIEAAQLAGLHPNDEPDWLVDETDAAVTAC